MRLAFALLLVVHGAIHLLGFAKAFGLADLPQLGSAITRPLGVLWLGAGTAYVAMAAVLFVSPERWWLAAAPAFALSQVGIITAWSDAKFGTIPNLMVFVLLALALFELRSSSLGSTYRRKVREALRGAAEVSLVEDADLDHLPVLVQRYLRRAGVVGRPRVHDFRAEWRGQLKNGAHGAWMEAQAEQVNVIDPAVRLYRIRASRIGIPFEGLHVYERTTATMRVRVASLFEVIDARGPEMDRSETVTLFNDMCMLAPAALVDADITWRPIDDNRIAATYQNGGIRIGAELVFDDAGDLVNFASKDRDQSADGKTFRRLRWSTPVRAYREVGSYRLPAVAEAVWAEPSGDLVYARFELIRIAYNIASDAAHGAPRNAEDRGKERKDGLLTVRPSVALR